MGGGTEAFPDLGQHCEREDCNQLDFLPFKCAGCNKVFCLEHRTYNAHDCSDAEHNSRIVVVCETCGIAIEKKAGEDEKSILDKHESSGNCDPSKKKKPTCPVKRCKETLTFSNSSTCKLCHVKVCLKHRFPSEHACRTLNSNVRRLPAWNTVACGRNEKQRLSSPPPIKAW